MSSDQEVVEARALLTALTGFSERAGHDMAGPLNQATSLLTLFIRRYRNRIDADADQLLDYLQNAADRMESASRGVRKFMEIAEKTPRYASVDLNDALAVAMERLKKEIGESRAEVIADCLPNALGDADQLALVFENLIGNCIKFCRPDAPPRVHIAAGFEGGMHVITIRDEGIGVDPRDHDMLFVAFKRLNGREYPGPGLGLAMARLIVEMYGGRIGMAPVPAGACVWFTLRPLPL